MQIDLVTASYGELLSAMHQIQAAMEQIESDAFTVLSAGHDMPNWKMQMGNKVRKIVEPELLAAALREFGVNNKDIYQVSVIGLKDFDKLVSARRIPESVYSPFIETQQHPAKPVYTGDQP